MSNFILETVSAPWARLFSMGKQGDMYESVAATPGPPDAANSNMLFGTNAIGVVNMGEGGGVAPNRILVKPFAEGEPGSWFWMRVYGWRPVLSTQQDANRFVWFPDVLAEFLCVTGNLSGPQRMDNVSACPELSLTENLCDGMTLMNGVLGLTGFVNTALPGLGIPAFAGVEVMGCKKVSFDFAFIRNQSNIAMNCFWTRA